MGGIIAKILDVMLIERLFGVGVYALLVAVVFVCLKRAGDLRTVKITLNMALAVLSLMAFFFIPDPSKDLYRWLEIAEYYEWGEYNLKDFYAVFLSASSTPLGYFMVYITAVIGVDGLLPMMSAFIFYLNVFHILKDLYKNYKIDGNMLALSFLFFMAAGAFLEVISGVRCFMALSIAARLTYDETVGRKSIIRSIPFYIIACLIHSAVIPIMIMRFIFALFIERKRSLFTGIMTIVACLISGFVILKFGTGFMDSMFDKAGQYLFNDRYSYFWEYLIGIIQWSAILYVLVLRRGTLMRETDIGFINLKRFLIFFMTVNIVFIFEYNIFHRFLVVTSMLFMPFAAGIDYNGNERDRAVYQRLMVISIALMILVCARGNLCGYKFFLLS